jgi:penicillin-binding protein 2
MEQRMSEIDVAGQVLRQDLQPPTDPIPGYNLRLTIDMRLQQAVYSIFEKDINFGTST